MHTLVAHLAAVTPMAVSNQGALSLLIKTVAPILLVIVGLVIIAGARKKDMSGAMTIFGIALLGLVVIAGGASLIKWSDQIAAQLFGG